MMVLQHDHSLSLIYLNPKYPHDEVVYDDEEDLIIKQAFKSSCDRCHQEITYYHKYYYKCDQCDYSLHKLCGEVPIELQHASHDSHILTLFLDMKSQGQCHICRNTIQYKQLQYHCSRCMFNICLACAMGKVQYLTIYHPSHQHPLNPACRQRQTLVECDACGEEHKGVFYECFTCFSSLMHNDCVFKPKRLLIQDVTSGRFFHTHQLILAYQFPRVYQKAKFDPACRVCENSFSDSENLWVYMCEKCRYYVHLKCTNLRFEPHHSGTVGTSKNYQDDPSVFHLPLSERTKTMFTKLFSKETNADSITHVSHQHRLILVDTMTNVENLCMGCLRPIMDMPFYKCNEYRCEFVLHELCTRLPLKLNKTCPKGHGLYLNQNEYRPNAFCRVCNHFCKGFFYRCSLCEYDYTVDAICALLIETVTHKSHPHHLLSRVQKRLHKDYCRMCLTGFNSKGETSFSCNICNFHLHRECALLLPETIRHKYDKHPMTLSYSPIENHEGDYFCEVCEEELNPYISFYHCLECAQSIHSACVQLEPLLKYSYTLYGFNEKGDSETTHRNEFHHHPLSFFKGKSSDRGCSECQISLEDDFILKCLQCNYAMHADHLNNIFYKEFVIGSLMMYPGHIQHDLWLVSYERLLRFDGTYLLPTRDHYVPRRCSDCSNHFGGDDYVFVCDKGEFVIHAYHIRRRDIYKYRRRTIPTHCPRFISPPAIRYWRHRFPRLHRSPPPISLSPLAHLYIDSDSDSDNSPSPPISSRPHPRLPPTISPPRSRSPPPIRFHPRARLYTDTDSSRPRARLPPTISHPRSRSPPPISLRHRARLYTDTDSSLSPPISSRPRLPSTIGHPRSLSPPPISLRPRHRARLPPKISPPRSRSLSPPPISLRSRARLYTDTDSSLSPPISSRARARLPSTISHPRSLSPPPISLRPRLPPTISPPRSRFLSPPPNSLRRPRPRARHYIDPDSSS